MELLLHIGTEKTGSSHLQTLASRGRSQLNSAGIAFPKGWPHDERCMASGDISAGNARLLAKAIHDSDDVALSKQLRACANAAREGDATRVLLTSEHLLPALASSDGLERFQNAANAIGFTTTRYFIILRDPTAQCLSLFKHRAKRGTAGDIAEWAERGYRLPQELQGFRVQAGRLGITPKVRGYTRTPGGLEQRFFEDWLGVPTPDVEMPERVNPSLTLSELVLIQQMAARRPALVYPLYEALLAIDPAEKVQGEAMTAYAHAVATAAVAAHADEWAAWNEYLPPGETLTIPAPPADILGRPRELGLTEQQMAALAAVIDEAASSRFVARMMGESRLRPCLGRVNRLVSR